MKTIRVKPRKGVELAGIPAAGADVPAELAEEWIAARLVTTQDGRSRSRPAKPADHPSAPTRDSGGRLQPAREA